METKHTPGPWGIRSTDTLLTIHGDDGVIMVASTSWHSRIRRHYPLKAEAEANARLIAATPDLLALTKFIDENPELAFSVVVQMARAALAKAAPVATATER